MKTLNLVGCLVTFLLLSGCSNALEPDFSTTTTTSDIAFTDFEITTEPSGTTPIESATTPEGYSPVLESGVESEVLDWESLIVATDSNVATTRDIAVILNTEDSEECVYGYYKDGMNCLSKITRNGELSMIKTTEEPSESFRGKLLVATELDGVPVIKISIQARFGAVSTFVTLKDGKAYVIPIDVENAFPDEVVDVGDPNNYKYNYMVGDEMCESPCKFNSERLCFEALEQ